MNKHKFYRKINSLLNSSFGIEMHKVAKRRAILDNKVAGKNNLIIEFVGVPGVGKSTLCHYYLKNHTIRFKREITTSNEVQGFDEGSDIDLKESVSGINGRLMELMFRKFHNSKYPVEKEINAIFLLFSAIQREFIVNTGLNDRIVFFDEHLLRHFKELYPLALPNDIKKQKKYLNKRIFIICTASHEKIFQNRKERAIKAGIKIPKGSSQNDWAIDVIQKDEEEIKIAAKQFQSMGAHILNLSTDDSLKKNNKIIDSFIADYLKNRPTE